MPTGLFSGLTTNPLLLQRAGVSCNLETLRDLAMTGFDLGADEIHMQVWGRSVDAMVGIGRELAWIDGRIAVKVPITREGCAAAHQLAIAGIKVTLTGVYAASQIAIADALGAKYAAPYLGRMNDAGRDGFGEITTMQRMVDNLGSDLRVVVASLRSAPDIARLAADGLSVFTLSPTIATEMMSDPLTEQAAIDFESAARDMGAK